MVDLALMKILDAALDIEETPLKPVPTAPNSSTEETMELSERVRKILALARENVALYGKGESSITATDFLYDENGLPV